MKIQGFPFPDNTIKECEYIPPSSTAARSTVVTGEPAEHEDRITDIGAPRLEGFRIVLHRHGLHDPPLVTRIPEEVTAIMEWLATKTDQN